MRPRFWLAAALAATSIACRGPTDVSSAAAASASVNGPALASVLIKGAKDACFGNNATTAAFTLTALVSPDTNTGAVVTWQTSNDKVVSVDKNGMVTITGVGSADITVFVTAHNSTVASSVRITVTACGGTGGNVPHTISLAPDTTINQGQSFQARPTFTPDTASNKQITFVSLNPSIVVVSSTGVVTGVSPGTTQVCVNWTLFSSSACITVTVRTTTQPADTVLSVSPPLINAQFAAVGVTSCSTSAPVQLVATYTIGQTTVTVPATSLTYTPSGGSAGFTVSTSGLVTFTGPGAGTIVVIDPKNTNRQRVVPIVVVSCGTNGGPGTSGLFIKLNPSNQLLLHGGTSCVLNVFQIQWQVFKKSDSTLASDQRLSFVSSNQAVAVVGSFNGLTAVNIIPQGGQGTAVITATSVADPTATASMSVVVDGQSCNQPPQVTISPNGGNLAVGATMQLTATGTQGGTWSSNGTSVLTINGTGLVTGVANGCATVTYTVNGATFTTAPFIVGTGCTSASIAISGPGTGKAGGNAVYSAAVTGLSNTGVTWSSSKPSVLVINSQTGVATFLNAGTATVTAVSVVDQTVRASVTVTVTP